ncbi:MAG: hypothetical protein E6J14_10450 [Chloroflexi bacterium]|nr:MAG: hypothetical protein E6J14_10450 [Chloroflexota bacterium]
MEPPAVAGIRCGCQAAITTGGGVALGVGVGGGAGESVGVGEGAWSAVATGEKELVAAVVEVVRDVAPAASRALRGPQPDTSTAATRTQQAAAAHPTCPPRRTPTAGET